MYIYFLLIFLTTAVLAARELLGISCLSFLWEDMEEMLESDTVSDNINQADTITWCSGRHCLPSQASQASQAPQAPYSFMHTELSSNALLKPYSPVRGTLTVECFFTYYKFKGFDTGFLGRFSSVLEALGGSLCGVALTNRQSSKSKQLVCTLGSESCSNS